jgi:hypothetical protein
MRTKLLLISILSLITVACADEKVIKGITYKPYGIFSEDRKDPKIRYEIVPGNLVWSIIFSETLIIPAWLIGFDLYEPVTTSDKETKNGK